MIELPSLIAIPGDSTSSSYSAAPISPANNPINCPDLT